jgi:hypothetical protein
VADPTTRLTDSLTFGEATASHPSTRCSPLLEALDFYRRQPVAPSQLNRVDHTQTISQSPVRVSVNG